MSKLELDRHGNIKCPHCGKYTSKVKIIVAYLECWNCDKVILESYEQTIKQLLKLAVHKK